MKRVLLIIIVIFYSCMLGCKEKNNLKIKVINNIEHIETNNDMIRDFDRVKYSIVQNAIILKLDEKYEESIVEFNRAENKYGEMIQIYLNRGDVFQRQGKFNQAEIDLNNCLKLDSTYLPALINRGLVYTHTNKLKKAVLDFNKAIELDSLEPGIYLNRAVAFSKANKYDLACIDLIKAKSLGIFEKYNSNQTNELIEKLNCIE